MLRDIIAKFLNISKDRAQAIIELLDYENRWQSLDISTIKTQKDFIQFIQNIGQKNWFKGHDRSRFPANVSDASIKETYFNFFKQIGLVDEVSYDKKQDMPHYAAVLGGWEVSVKERTKSMEKDCLAGIVPTEHIVFGLSAKRPLGALVPPGSEEKMKAELIEKNKEPNEMEMVDMIVSDSVNSLNSKSSELRDLSYQSIGVITDAKSCVDSNRVKTGDTAVSLKGFIETTQAFKALSKPIKIAVYSNQPFVDRQALDTQVKLGPDYCVIGVGKALPFEFYKTIPTSVSICLGEIARLFNTHFTTKALNLAPYNERLNDQELNELSRLRAEKIADFEEEKPIIITPDEDMLVDKMLPVLKEKTTRSQYPLSKYTKYLAPATVLLGLGVFAFQSSEAAQNRPKKGAVTIHLHQVRR